LVAEFKSSGQQRCMNSTTQFGNETTTKLQDHAHLGAETHMDCQTTAGLGLMN